MAEPYLVHNSVRSKSRKNRVYIFREFVKQTYGDYLSASCSLSAVHANEQPIIDQCSSDINTNGIILDVAGGKGTLSWLLMNVDHWESVVVDPQCDDYATNCYQKLFESVSWLQRHPIEATMRTIPNSSTFQPLAALLPFFPPCEESSPYDNKIKYPTIAISNVDHRFYNPRNCPIHLDQAFIDAVRNEMNTRMELQCLDSQVIAPSLYWKEFWTEAMNRRTAQPEVNIASLCVEVWTAEEALAMILRTKLIVGFHPDQATEAIVDLANLLHIPYCIVPCCVFPSEFPNRRLCIEENENNNEQDTIKVASTTRKVKSYSDFIQYLKKKDKCCRSAHLTFHESETSRNLVLYTLPGEQS
jgi:hypothetical protein